MTELARESVKRGQNDQALARYHKALKLAQQLAKADPADYRPVHQQGIILRDLGGMYAMALDDERALAVLAECERLCGELKSRYGFDSGRLLAGVKVQRSMVMLHLGYGASAVLTMDSALNGYAASLGGDGDYHSQEMSLVLYPALVANALALMSYGDPDLAAASANRGWRGYLGLRDAWNWDAGCMEQAATAASGVLALSGRLDDALEADAIAIEVLEAARPATHRKRLATALANRGLHLQSAGRQDHLQEAATCLARSQALDATASAEAAATWELGRAQEPPVRLAAALETAAELLGREHLPADLPATLTSPPDTVVSPSGRCDMQSAQHFAAELARLALDLLPLARREGLRLGLEAHYLFAIAFRHDSRARQLESGIIWTRLVLECCRTLATEPADLALALDLAEQNLGLIKNLVQTAPGQHSDSGPDDPTASPAQTPAAEVLRDCLVQHAELFSEAGQPDIARHFRDTATSIDRRTVKSS